MRVERQWRRIHEYDAAGNHEAARIACVSLVEVVPDDFAAWEYLAGLETRLGHYRAAHVATTHAISALIRSGAIGRLSHLTLKLLGFDERLAVRELIESADHDSPAFLKQAPVLAQHLMLSGDDAAALALCAEARGRVRPDARIEYVSGLSSRNLGDATGAEEAFERAIAIDPDFSPAHWSLAYHRPAGLPRLRRLEAAVARLRANASAMTDLCYAIYRENEAAGRPHVAWTWLARGAAAARSRTDAGGKRLGRATVSAHPEHLDPPAERLADSIFIVGLPRSGTTVLERILGNHSRVHSAGELNCFHAALCHQADAFLPSPTSTRDVPMMHVVDNVGAMYARASRRYVGDERIVLDKNPANFLYTELIARTLPGARILCLRRAPMDACFSNLRELFDGDAYPYSYALDSLAEHFDWFDRMRTAYEVALPGRFMTVSYEAMIADPRAVAERVLTFCGLDYEEGCEHIERNATPVSTASSSQVREAIHARGVGAWQAYGRFLEPIRTRLNELGVVA